MFSAQTADQSRKICVQRLALSLLFEEHLKSIYIYGSGKSFTLGFMTGCGKEKVFYGLLWHGCLFT